MDGMRFGPERRSRIALLYHSGTGGTRLVAELLGEILAVKHESRVKGIQDPRAVEVAADCDLLVFCYPTYFLRPAPSMREFIEGFGPFDPPRASYMWRPTSCTPRTRSAPAPSC